MSEFFYCYNAFLRKYLEESEGIEPVSFLLVNVDNDRRYKMYRNNDELTKAIARYKTNRNKKPIEDVAIEKSKRNNNYQRG